MFRHVKRDVEERLAFRVAVWGFGVLGLGFGFRVTAYYGLGVQGSVFEGFVQGLRDLG